MKNKNYKIRINKGGAFSKLLLFTTATVTIFSSIYILYYAVYHNFLYPLEVCILFSISSFIYVVTGTRTRGQVPDTWLSYTPQPEYERFLKSIPKKDMVLRNFLSPYNYTGDIVRDKLLNKMFDEIESKYKEQYYSGNDFEKNQILLSVKDSVYDDVLEKV